MNYTQEQRDFLDSVDAFIARNLLYTASEWELIFSDLERRYLFDADYTPPIPASLLYWWTFDEAGGTLPWNVPTGHPDYPVEYNGNNGNTLAGGSPAPISTGGEFGNYIRTAELMMATPVSLPSAAHALDVSGSAITLDFWVQYSGNVWLSLKERGEVPKLLELEFNSGSSPELEVTGRDTTPANHSITISPGAPGATWHHVRVVMEQSGADGILTVWYDGAAPVTNTFVGIDWGLLVAPAIPGILEFVAPVSSISVDNLAIFQGAFPLPGDGTVPTQANVWPNIS